MKITSLHVSNLLSFDSFHLEFSDGLTVIVGPNGSGKTNIVRVLDLVSKLVDWSDERGRAGASTATEVVVASYAQAVHNDPPAATPIEVRLSLELTTQAERHRMVSFIRAGILATLLEEARGAQEPARSLLSSWIEKEIVEARLESLFSGVLTFRHPGYDNGVWDTSYEFNHVGHRYAWILHNAESWDASIVSANRDDAGSSSSSTTLWEALFAESPHGSAPPILPDSLPQFELNALCLPPGRRLSQIRLRTATGVFNDSQEPFREAGKTLELPPTAASTQQAYGLARVLRICLREGLAILGEQFRGLGIGGTIPWRAGVYPWEFLAGPVPTRDPAFLPLRLFQLKNGATVDEREQFTTIQTMFARLAPGRYFDVTFTAANVPVPSTSPIGAGQVAMPVSSEQSGGQQPPGCIVTVVVSRKANDIPVQRERPIQLHGAGTWEALVLAEALVRSDGRLTVLDEPAINLHPTWQSVLRAALQAAPGQVVLVTHAPNLVPMDTAEQLRRLCRVSDDGGASRVHRLPETLNTATVAKVSRTFGMSSDARALLFCRGAVVLEGETELGAIPIWFSKSRAAQKLGSPTDVDLGFYSVSGDGGFANIIAVLHRLGIPWVVVCDGKAFDVWLNWNSHIFRQIERAGCAVPELTAFLSRVNKGGKTKRRMTEALWDEQLPLGARHGVFTLATSWSSPEESIEAFCERVAPGMLAKAEQEVGDSKTRKGRWLAQETPCPDDVDDLYRRVLAVLTSTAY